MTLDSINGVFQIHLSNNYYEQNLFLLRINHENDLSEFEINFFGGIINGGCDALVYRANQEGIIINRQCTENLI